MSRPAGVSAGGIGLLLAWVGGATIARLTGSTPVVIVLAAGLVLFAVASVAGYVVVRRVAVGSVQLPTTVTQGEPFPLSIAVDAARPVWIDVRVADHVVVGGWSRGGRFSESSTIRRRGPFDRIEVVVRSAGAPGLVWWRRSLSVIVGEHLVAARAHRREVTIEREALADGPQSLGRTGAIAGEIDGVRPWREGDSERYVHWASTVRAGELVVHDRRGTAAASWIVRARPDSGEPDVEAGAVRRALEQGLRTGAPVGVAIGNGEVVAVPDADAALRWSALAPLGACAPPTERHRVGWRTPEPESTSSAAPRWWAAAATFVALAMLIGALDYGPTMLALTAAGTAAGAAVSARSLVSGAQPSALTRAFVAVGATIALVMVVAASGRLDSLIAFMRGPLPQVLIVLIVLHGFEAHDRRTIRVGLAISAVVMMYASGFRVDDGIGWWLLAWAICFGTALTELARPTAGAGSARRWAAGWPSPTLPGVATVGAGLAVTVAILAIVPVPDGPANLTLPTLIEDPGQLPRPGVIAGPDGEVRDGDEISPDGGPDRAPAGQAGGYTGFAEQMDTSVRGELGDEVVMRVRAPEPDFWRGQTFSRFDGRRWTADPEQGPLRVGPNIDVPSALGDIRLADDVIVEQFVQTYHLEVDMPNLIFHANRPTQVIVDADVWTRPDGALRASTVLGEGSIYTVVSGRPGVDQQLLRRQGLIGPRLTDRGRLALGRYLEVPPSTSPETVELARRLADGQPSTYDVVRAYEGWMRDNVEYDLDAPLPDAGEDAVHDFLFDTRLGFCEQIASSMTIMLRTQGVPARLVTGYLPGTRDRIAGVFEVRSSDAHAWVEVWFPETGWQAFDPTAAVPLSADAAIDSIGSDLLEGAGRYVGAHRMQLAVVSGLAFAVLASMRSIGELRRRRRRGRWGLLQDRFANRAIGRGATAGAPNTGLAAVWTEADDAAVAQLIAERLDRVAFDPGFVDDDSLFTETTKLVRSLPGPAR